MKEFKVSIDTIAGPRWFLVEASSLENAETEATEVSANHGRIKGIEESREDDFDLSTHLDS
jgi:hypothetical protein